MEALPEQLVDVEVPPAGGDVRTESPESSPQPEEAALEQSGAVGEPEGKQGGAKLRSGVDAAYAGRLGGLRSRPRQTLPVDDPAALLREMLTAQADIARGKGKGVTVAMQTAASKEVRELLAAMKAETPIEAGVSWDDVPELQREACSLVLRSSDALALMVLDLTDVIEPDTSTEGDDPAHQGVE